MKKNKIKQYDSIIDFKTKDHDYKKYSYILGDDNKTLKALVKFKWTHGAYEKDMLKELDMILDGYVYKDEHDLILEFDEVILMGNTFLPLTQRHLFKGTNLIFKRNLIED